MEIAFDPWKKVVIHELVEFKLQDFLRQIEPQVYSSAGSIPVLFWCNGVLYFATPMPESELSAEQMMEGVIHFSNVTFALMPRYQPQLREGRVTVNVMDVSASSVHQALTNWMKTKGVEIASTNRSTFQGNGTGKEGEKRQ
jgi:hypothetical protein